MRVLQAWASRTNHLGRELQPKAGEGPFWWSEMKSRDKGHPRAGNPTAVLLTTCGDPGKTVQRREQANCFKRGNKECVCPLRNSEFKQMTCTFLGHCVWSPWASTGCLRIIHTQLTLFPCKEHIWLVDWQNAVDIVFILVKQLTASSHMIVANMLTHESEDHSPSGITSRRLIQKPEGRLWAESLGALSWVLPWRNRFVSVTQLKIQKAC